MSTESKTSPNNDMDLIIDQRIYDLYDEYCHGTMERREFLRRASLITVAGVSGLVMAQALLPRYAAAQTISFTDERIKANYVKYDSPGGNSGKDARLSGAASGRRSVSLGAGHS